METCLERGVDLFVCAEVAAASDAAIARSAVACAIACACAFAAAAAFAGAAVLAASRRHRREIRAALIQLRDATFERDFLLRSVNGLENAIQVMATEFDLVTGGLRGAPADQLGAHAEAGAHAG